MITEEIVILLAEDDAMLRNLIRAVLERDGYVVLVAADGIEALEMSRAHEGNIDLLLTDMEMPRSGGLTAYQEICRARPATNVLFMSGRLQVRLPYSVPFLAKPFDLHSLRKKVWDALEMPSSEGGCFKVILVVDYKADRRERMQDILADAGYAVMSAGSVEEAEAISDGIARIDLIVSGVVFPGRSGIHLAEHVESSPREINTLLISHTDRNVLAGMAGFSRQPEFMPNPFTPEQLLDRVGKLLKNA